MTALDIELDKAYVVKVPTGLRIALAVGRTKNGDLLVKMRMGWSGMGFWYRRARKLESVNVRRLASEREVDINMPIGPVPAPG